MEDSSSIPCSDWPMSLKQVSAAQKNKQKKNGKLLQQSAILIVAVFLFLVDTFINQGNMKFIYFLNSVTVFWNFTSLNYIYFHFRHADGSIKFWDASSGTKEKDYKLLFMLSYKSIVPRKVKVDLICFCMYNVFYNHIIMALFGQELVMFNSRKF